MRHSLARYALLLLAAYNGFSQPEISPAPDNSLRAIDFVTQGLPSYDHVWSSLDYSLAVSVLRRICEKDAILLPRRNSTRSGMVFNRIVSFDNLDAVKNAADMSQRITIYGSITDSLAAIIALYGSATRPSVSFDVEIVDLATIYMEDIARTYDTANELLLSLPPDNQLRQDEPAFRKKFSAGTSAMFAIFFTILSDREEIRRSELLRLAHALRKYLDLLKSQVLAGSMEEIRVRVNDLMNSETDEGLKEALSGLLSVIGG